MISDCSRYKLQDEKACVETLLETLEWSEDLSKAISARSIDFIETARQTHTKSGEVEAFLREYGLETHEGLALMTLAEALLRVPDKVTANALIRDKINQAEWRKAKSEDWLLKATSLGLNITKKTLNSLVAKLGEPMINRAIGYAMRMMGRQFVLGRTIEKGMKTRNCSKRRGIPSLMIC